MRNRSSIIQILPLTIWVVGCTSANVGNQETEAEPTNPSPQGDFVPTAAQKEEYLADIRIFIDEMNDIISRENYNAWVTHLTDRYQDKFGDSDYLRQRSQTSSKLRSEGIIMEDLHDYFNFVVVPSRADVRVDNISFLSQDSVKAYMEIQGKMYLVYDLIRNNGTWQIDYFS